MEIANSKVINSLYLAHIMAIENNDSFNGEEKYVLETILQKIKKDETLSFESKKSMFVLLDKAISDTHINGNILKLDKGLFSVQTDLQEQEYEQAVTFFVAVKNEKNDGKEKINNIYLNFFSDCYKEFNVGDTTSERAFIVKAYEELGERFGYKEVLVQGTKVDLKSAIENLAEIYSDLSKEYKEHQQQKLEQEKVIELQKAHQLEKNKIAEQIVNKLKHVSVLGELRHIDYRCFASITDIKNFFLQPKYNMSENDVNDIFDILSNHNIEQKIFSGLDVTNLSNRSLDDLKRISEKLDKPVELIEQNLIELVNYVLIASINKRIKELKPQANSIYKNNNESRIKAIENVERSINYSTQSISRIENDKKRLYEDMQNDVMNLSRELNIFNIKDIHNPKTLNIVDKFEFKEPKFNFSSNFEIFDEKHVNTLIESIKKVSGDYIQLSVQKPAVENFLKNIKTQYQPHIEKVKEDFDLRKIILRTSYLNEYVSKKWYSVLGPLAKWAVNKFSKRFLQEVEVNYSNKLNEVIKQEKVLYKKYKNEVERYVDEKLKYTADHIKYDERLKEYNTCCKKADDLYHQVVKINTEKDQIFNTVFQNMYHDGTYFNIEDIRDFSPKTKKEIQIFEKKLTELETMIWKLESDIDNLSDEFKGEPVKNFKSFSKEFSNYKRQTLSQLSTLNNTLSNVELIQEKNNMLSKINEDLKSEQTKLKGLKAELNSSAEKAINAILKDLENDDETIGKINSAFAMIVSKPNLSTILSLVNNKPANDKITSVIANNFSSGAAGGQA